MSARASPRDLQRRLVDLQAELERTQAELAALGPGEKIPGLFVQFEAGSFHGLLPTALVQEIVRLVELTPLPQRSEHVLGSFLYRGEPALALDLASYVGEPREPAVDAHMLVLRTARPVALVVDRVSNLAESLVTAELGQTSADLADVPGRLVAGLCVVGGRLLPLVNLQPLLEVVEKA